MTLLVIPVTVFLVQQQQNTRSQATPNTTLNFVPSEKPAEVGGKVDFEVWISPGNNQVNFIKLVIGYDGTKLTASPDSFELNTASNLSVIKPLAINDAGNELTLVLSAQNPTKVINQNMKIGTISFTVNEASETPIQIAFNDQSIQIRSINGANQDAFNENVYTKNGATASITTQGATDLTPTITETLTPTPSITLTPTPSLTPTPTSTDSGDSDTSPNQSPVCENLIADRSTEGTAPLSITFTANGSDSDGTISKASFSFGDGTVEDVTTGGGLGTATVNVQKSFTYNNAGTFTASALLTDDGGAVSSDSESCSTTVTVTDGSGTGTDSGASPIPPTGPSKTIFGIGALGGVLAVIGALLFFAL